MNKNINIILLLLITIRVLGQSEFAPIGAVWHYSSVENFAGDEGYVKITSVKDTLINSKGSRVLSQVRYSSLGDSTQLAPIYIHQTGDSILYWVDSTFQLMYDFSVDKNDTIEIFSKICPCIDCENHFGKVIVDSVFSVNINGFSLKQISTKRIKGSIYGYLGDYIELIGGIRGIYPADTCIVDLFPEIGDLRCYFDPTFGYYQLPNRLLCDSLKYISVIDEETINPEISAFYNLDKGTIQVKFNNNIYSRTLQIKVFNCLGRTIQCTEVYTNNDSFELQIRNKQNGIYILQIYDKNKILYNEKICLY